MFHEEFYPTPPTIVSKMLSRISKDARDFLEPSAGKGDIADRIRQTNGYNTGKKIDCIEISPELVSILLDKGHNVVGYEWLTYDGVCYYDAIIMNPPFSNGDDHLLKAWDFLHHGEIVCLLNAETIRNPYTAQRKRLSQIVATHGDVEFLEDCFSKAERKTNVEIAMVYLKKISEDDSFDLWSSEGVERKLDDNIGGENSLIAIDRLGNMEHFYNEANQHMFKAFQHIRKAITYMNANDARPDLREIFSIAIDNINSAKAEFSRSHRKTAWRSVFEKMEFRRWLDKKQTEEFIRDIEKHGNIPFTAANIKGTLENVFLARGELFEKSVANVFEALTRFHKDNTNYKEGWKSNDNYKVNERIVFPYGCKFDPTFGRYFSHVYHSSQIDIYNDLDRILCGLEGKTFETSVTIYKAMDKKFQELGRDIAQGFDSQCESDFFNIRFFMKGTVHLRWKDKEVMYRFNKTAARGRAWIGKENE